VPKWVGVLPAIESERTLRCLKSMDQSVRDRVILVDNGTTWYPTPPTLDKIEPQRNLGVARSWNYGVQAMINDPEIEQLWLMSTSVEFRKGGLDWVAQMDQADEFALGVAHLGWHLHGFTRKTIETVGSFDEHFYPAYYEDTDYIYRMSLAGLPAPRENGRSWPYIFIDSSYAGDAQALKSGLVNAGDESHQYYIRKWGGDQGQETFTTPFDSDHDWTWWP
jgi:hypothetical protein